MKKEFEAYYSKAYAWIFAVLLMLFISAIVMFSVFWIPNLSLIFIITLSVISLVLAYMFVITIRKDGVAIEIRDNKFFLYKRQPVEIPIEEIFKIGIHNGDGSFDILVKTSSQKFSMHCFIKEQRKKKDELISLFKNKGIKVDTFDLSGGD